MQALAQNNKSDIFVGLMSGFLAGECFFVVSSHLFDDTVGFFALIVGLSFLNSTFIALSRFMETIPTFRPFIKGLVQ